MNNNLSTNSKLSTTKSFENLYCLDAKNKIKEWQIYVEDMVTHSVMIYSYGYIDGKKVECNQIINKGKNIGKKIQQLILNKLYSLLNLNGIKK